jgi:hypothetical protein
MSLQKLSIVFLAFSSAITCLAAIGSVKRQTLYPPNIGLNSTSSLYADAQNATVFAMAVSHCRRIVRKDN